MEISGLFPFSIAQEFRSGLDVLFDKLKSKYKLSMPTGDQPGATTKLLGLFQQKNALHFGLKPIDKLDFISKHQQKQVKKYSWLAMDSMIPVH